MSGLKGINKLRRRIMNKMTRKIGHSQVHENPGSIDKDQIRKILICRPNHRLGNLLLITPLVQEVTKIFPNSKIDLFTKGGLAPIVFRNYDNIDGFIQLPKKHFSHLLQYSKAWLTIKRKHYDLVINVEKGSSSGRLSTEFARASYKFFGADQENIEGKSKDYQHIAKKSIYDFREYLGNLGVGGIEQTEIPSLDLKLTPSEIVEGEKILQELVQKNERTICLFTYATDNKRYPKSWWLKFHEKLKLKYRNHNIIEVLPVENVSQIAFKEASFYSKDIRQIASLIANTDIFIGADSGIMHLASAAKTPTIGLFSRSNSKKYEPYHNKSRSISVDHNSGFDEVIAAMDKILPTE